MKTCPYCKKEISDNDKFCGWCGKKIPQETPEERKAIEEIKRKAREEERQRKEAKEKEKEGKTVKKVREQAQEEVKRIEKEKTKRGQILEKLTKTPPIEKKRREEYLQKIGIKGPKINQEKIEQQVPEKKEVVFRPFLQIKPSSFEKVWIRVLLLMVIFSLAALATALQLDILKLGEEGPSLPVNGNGQEEKKETPAGDEIEIPASLLRVDASSEMEIESLETLPSAFLEKVRGDLEEKTFTRIIIEDMAEKEVISLSDFFGAFNIDAPESFYQSMDENLTIVVYSPANRHLALLAEVKEGMESELTESLIEWQKEMIADFDFLFSSMGKSKMVPNHPIQKEGYLGRVFYSTTFFEENFSLSYSLIDGLFMFATSEELMQELIESKVKLTKDLKTGDQNTEVLILQTWLAEDIKIYPEGTITGYYGGLTERAVARFQQKYSEDILKPFGLVEGTGMVDKSTRDKLNEIYRR